MKAVIVDLQDQKAAALCEDGSVREIPDAGYAPGQTIELPELVTAAAEEASEEENASAGSHKRKGRRTSLYFRQIAAAAAACFLVAGIGAGTVWAMPYGKVHMENGSSLSYTINRFDYVLEVEADNEAGEEVLEELDLKQIVHKKIDSAVEQTLVQMEQNEDQNNAVNASPADGGGKIEIVTEIKNEKHAEKIKERLNKVTEAAADNSSLHDKEKVNAEKPEDDENREGDKPGNESPDDASGKETGPEGLQEASDSEQQGGSSSGQNSSGQKSSGQDSPASQGKESPDQTQDSKTKAPEDSSQTTPSGNAPGEDFSESSGNQPPHPADAPGGDGQQGGPGSPF